MDTLASVVQNNYTLESLIDNTNFKADFSKSKISRIIHYQKKKSFWEEISFMTRFYQKIIVFPVLPAIRPTMHLPIQIMI
jgi:hypothetical protein